MRVSEPSIQISNSSPLPTAYPTAIVNASPTVEPIDNASPASTVLPSYDDYLYWRDHYENKTTPGNPTSTPLLNGDPALTNSVRIYTATPTPVATPTPSPAMNKEKHTDLRAEDSYLLPDSSKDATTTGIMAWDAAASKGLYSYYYKGDYANISLRFVSQYWKPIDNPTIIMKLSKQDVFGGWHQVQYSTWNETAHLEPTMYDESGRIMTRLPGDVWVNYQFEVPDKIKYMGYNVDTSGRYLLECQIFYDNVQACSISKQVQII
jgi:hypothetical protein